MFFSFPLKRDVNLLLSCGRKNYASSQCLWSARGYKASKLLETLGKQKFKRQVNVSEEKTNVEECV